MDTSSGAVDSTGGDGPFDPIQRMFELTAIIEGAATEMTALAPEVGAVTQDYVTLLRQVVPQAAAARLSGQPLGMAPGAGAAMSAAAPQGSPQPGGLGMLAGMGAGQGTPPPSGGMGMPM